MDTHLELLGQADALFNRAKEQPYEDAEKTLVEARQLKARAIQLKEIEAHMGEAARRVETKQEQKDAAAEERKDPKQFRDWEEYLRAAWWASHPKNNKGADPRLQSFKDESEPGHEKKDLAENVGASGGFLVPVEFLAQLQQVIGENSIVQPRATIIRMKRRQVDLPVLSQTGTTAGVPHWFGGISFYYGEENAEKTESDPAFRKVTLSAHKLYGYTRSSDELVEDSAISLADFFSGPLGFAGGVAWWRDYTFLRGTGVGQPLGVVNAGATITVARAAVGTPIQYVDLVNMMESFLPSARGVWVAHQSTMSNFLTMVDPLGGYIWHPNYSGGGIAGAMPGTLFGLPIIFTEKLPRVGSAGDVLLADFRYYLVGDRQAATIETTKYDRWRYDQTSWRVVDRHDGQPWLSAPLTLQDGTSQVSPFVILGAKST